METSKRFIIFTVFLSAIIDNASASSRFEKAIPRDNQVNLNLGFASLLPSSGPKSPLIRFGDGRIVAGKHTFFPDLPPINGYTPGNWQLDQSPGRELLEPTEMRLDDDELDPVLGKADWIFPSQNGVSHLKIYKNSRYGMVYEMLSKGGYVNIYGGSGFIFSPVNVQKQNLNGKIRLDLDFRIAKVISSNPEPTKNPNFHWFSLSGLYFHVQNPQTGTVRPFLIQILHANHTPVSEATNFKFDNGVDAPMLGGIIDSDLNQVFYKKMDDFKHISLDVNKYICYATKQEYGSVSEKKFSLPEYFKNPKNWSFTGYFFDLEHAAGTCMDPNPVYGESCPSQHQKDFNSQVEVAVQVANINLTQQAMNNFTDVCQDYPEVEPTAKFLINNQAINHKTVNSGESIDLKYESSATSSCDLTAYIDNKRWYQNKNFSTAHDFGRIKITDPATYKWDILCQNNNGKTSSASTSLTVVKPILPTASFYIDNQLNPTRNIKPGESIDLRYESNNSQSCILTSHLNGVRWYQNVDFLTKHSWGKIPFNEPGSYNWDIVCKNANGQTAAASASLKVSN